MSCTNTQISTASSGRPQEKRLHTAIGEAAHINRYNVDLDALGGPVRWAGRKAAPFWLDVAREYTEYWTHQQQICDAVGRPGLTDERYLGPVIDTFLRALPQTRCAT